MYLRLSCSSHLHVVPPPRGPAQSSAGTSDGSDNRGMKRKAEDSDDEPEPEDNVR